MSGQINKNVNGTSRRTDTVLRRKMIQYLIPAMLTTAAFSLSEFVDSMILANILNSDAMAIIQLGSPVILICATAYILIGNGGSTLYSICLGERDIEKAGGYFGVSVVSSMIIGIVLTVLGFAFFEPLSHIMCKDPELYDEFVVFFKALLWSVPFLIIIMSTVCFLAPAGAPQLATVVNVVANVVNIAMDYIYIRVFDMGVEGAAYATLTGYLIGGLILIFALFSKKADIKRRKLTREDLALFPEIVKTGSPFSATQLGYAIKIAFCNAIAAYHAGAAGVVGFSLCIQSLSIISIFLAAVIESASPILGMLHGQKDYRGEKMVLRRALILQSILSFGCTVFFYFFPDVFATFYDIDEPERLMMAMSAVSTFSLIYLVRGYYIVFMKYLQIIGLKLYALLISVCDGFVIIIPLSLIMSHLTGIDGLWLSFPINAAIVFVGCLITNLIIARRNKDKYTGILLDLKPRNEKVLLDVTIMRSDDHNISALSEDFQRICEENGMDKKTSVHASLLLEEMTIYLKDHIKKDGYVDILVKGYDDYISLDFRSTGASIDPNDKSENDFRENIRLLKGLARQIKCNYVMGMNNISVEFETV